MEIARHAEAEIEDGRIRHRGLKDTLAGQFHIGLPGIIQNRINV